MATPRVHIVGGFLGSGKTTAIAAASRILVQRGVKVGVVTNDQGRYLVDTLFFEMEKVPTVEVTGGCFCCNYDDFEERLSALDKAARPEIIFAESVGSCADVVATVIQPLLQLSDSGYVPSSFSVFGDSRLLRQRLEGGAMPFSEEVVYIFDKQLEEAGQIVVSKADLQDEDDMEKLLLRVKARFPGKQVLIQNTLAEDGVQPWLSSIESGRFVVPKPLDEMDYEIYGAGEAELAWLDREVSLELNGGDGHDVIQDVLSGIETEVRARAWPVGHLKFIVESGGQRAKVSVTTADAMAPKKALPPIQGGRVNLLINARVAAPKEDLDRLVQKVIEDVAEKRNICWQSGSHSSFHPSYPRPTHRVS